MNESIKALRQEIVEKEAEIRKFQTLCNHRQHKIREVEEFLQCNEGEYSDRYVFQFCSNCDARLRSDD
jgi:hypothetical protein